jgi:hypothetical protein
MDKTAALHCLKSIQSPILVDGGYWEHGRMFFILTESGLYTIDCRVFDPLLGPIEYSPEEYREISEIAKEGGDLSENSDLDSDEKLFLFNNGKPSVPYWAFQPHEDAALGEYTFSAEKADVEAAFINNFIKGEVEVWEAIDAESLIAWAESVALYGKGEL